MLKLLPALALLFSVGNAAANAQVVASTLTTADLSQRMASQPALQLEVEHAPAVTSGDLVIDVTDDERGQRIDGFGASMTDGAAWLLATKLTPAQRDAVMTKLFSPTKGVGLSFLRQPIGSTDLSRAHFSFDERAQADPGLAHFSIAPDEPYVLPLLRQALALNPQITVMATPWSAPAWMKTGGSMDGGGLATTAMPAFAAYLTRTVTAFGAAGVPIKYLTIGNEPLHDTKDFPGMYIPAAQAARFIGEDLGPALQQAHLSTRVLAYDHNWDHPEYPLAVLADATASPFVAGSAMHCYGGNVDAQNSIHAAAPGKGIWLTECSGGTWDREPALIKTARLLIESTRDWAKAVVLWGMVLDTEHNPHDGGCGTCRPLVELDLHQSPTTVAYTGDFYGLAQASAFVHPGATRIGSTSYGRDSLETVAFANPNHTHALLILNNGASAASFVMRWHSRAVREAVPAKALETLTW